MKKIIPLASAILSIFLTTCTDNNKSVQGTLFIIGGGDKSLEMMNELVDLSGIRNEGTCMSFRWRALFPTVQ